MRTALLITFWVAGSAWKCSAGAILNGQIGSLQARSIASFHLLPRSSGKPPSRASSPNPSLSGHKSSSKEKTSGRAPSSSDPSISSTSSSSKGRSSGRAPSGSQSASGGGAAGNSLSGGRARDSPGPSTPRLANTQQRRPAPGVQRPITKAGGSKAGSSGARAQAKARDRYKQRKQDLGLAPGKGAGLQGKVGKGNRASELQHAQELAGMNRSGGPGAAAAAHNIERERMELQQQLQQHAWELGTNARIATEERRMHQGNGPTDLHNHWKNTGGPGEVINLPPGEGVYLQRR